MNKKKQNILTAGGASCVRFSPVEYEQVLKLKDKYRRSIPNLLKDALFKRLPEKVLFSQKDLDSLRNDLARIGNNANQIARKINSGFMHGWDDTHKKVLAELIEIKRVISYGYGVH